MKVKNGNVIDLFLYAALLIKLVMYGCGNGHGERQRDTRQQIDSLQLDSTEIFEVAKNSLASINLNQFLEKRAFSLDSLLSDIKLIPLETTDESLVDGIYKVIVSDSNIYVHDKFKGGGILIFDIYGKFLRRIPNGEGPGELTRLYDIDYDKSRKELIAYQHSFLLFFTPSGEFIRQQKLPLGFYNFLVTDDGYVFKAIDDQQGNQHLSSVQNYTLMVTDKNFKLRHVGMPSVSTNINFGGYSNLSRHGQSIYVTERFANDTIYRYNMTTHEFAGIYILDYNTKKFPVSYLTKTWDEAKKILDRNDYYYYLGEYLDVGDIQVIYLENHQVGRVTVFRDKKSGNMIGGSEVYFNLNEIPAIGFPKGTAGEYFFLWYMPGSNDQFAINSTTISAEDKSRIKSLTENDNPVLVLYTLRHF